MTNFGWWYPAGAANDSNAPWNQQDPPCSICGQYEDDCICPECPVCGGVGDPACYDGAIQCNWCGTRPGKCAHCADGKGRMPDQEFKTIAPHGLTRSFAQVALRAQAEAQWAADAEAEDRYYQAIDEIRYK